uniref:F-box domain-containing protein n=1 Tax=Tetradesmus obliquus TaxID=3088 RepID=A0A383VT61_TETOB|eukprot:jgi/Sobl393_1/16317/SZX67952.1
MEAIAEGVKAAPPPQRAAAAAAPDKAGQPTASSTAKAATPHIVSTAPYSSWKMQALRCHPLGGVFRAVPLPGVLLKQLPAATLTRLVCSLEFKHPKHLAALCGLTALRSLEVLPQLEDGADLADCSSHALRPMSALQQLMVLKLDCVKACQLAHLQLPQLQRLVVCISRGPCADPAEQQRRRRQQQQQQQEDPEQPLPLQLGHLTALTYLEGRRNIMLASDELPMSLRAVNWTYEIAAAACSVQPLLRLTSLEDLDMTFCVPPPAAAEMRQLTNLQHLTAVRFADYNAEASFAAGIEPAWGVLPLTNLKLFGSRNHGCYGSGTYCALMSAAALHALSKMTLLQSLTMPFNRDAGDSPIRLEATCAQLAAVLQPLTALQELDLNGPELLGDEEMLTPVHPVAAAEAEECAKQQHQQLQMEASDDEEYAAELLRPPPARYQALPAC